MEKSKQLLIESLREKGFDEKILNAFQKVKRENFVPDHLKAYAYEDMALPIEAGSTISQPYTIAFMLSLLDPKQNQRILEIGSGSGYVLSLISEIIKNGEIYGIEINKTLAIKSKKLLEKDSNIDIIHRSGISDLPNLGDLDRILISASCPDLRIPYNLVEQLAPGGILVSPVQSSIFKLTKTQEGKILKQEHPGFVFVPLRSEE